jgi:uncharacterized membrane protein YphA (DoxX/SURF4 family)
MTTTTLTRSPAVTGTSHSRIAHWLLRLFFIAAPILSGIDKFFNIVTDWDRYLWSGVPEALPLTAEQVMYGVGAIEIIAGTIVAFAPRIGSLIVAGWLAAIIGNLTLASIDDGTPYWDIAVRDFGLMVSALALFFLSTRTATARHRR